jgi:hypothetical protein
MYLLLIRLFTLLRITLTGFILVVSGIGLALFLIFYGIKAGLVDKKIHIYRLVESDVTDKEAVRNGWFYIVMGLIVMAIFIRQVILHYEALAQFFHFAVK